MSRALVISVGTGIGEGEEAVSSLAGALAYSIDSINPDRVYFVVSEESLEGTLPRVLSYKPLDDYEVIKLNSPDDIQRIFRETRGRMEEIRQQHNYVAVDYTSGTKAMTSALAMLGVLYEANVLCNVTGERRNGIVQKGTESLQTVRPMFAISEKRIQTALRFFNNSQYDTTISIINDVEKHTTDQEILARLNVLKTASKAYSTWDKFNHEEAFKELKKLKDPIFNANKRFLGMLLRSGENERGDYYIADLYSNVIRRGNIEKKYDDAVARLYRIVELLAQHHLKESHDIDASSVSLEDLPEPLKTEWRGRFQNGRTRIGLQDSYKLLKEIGDDLGKMLDSEKMRALMSKRNYSILAHGLTPVDEKTYSDMKEEVYRNVSRYIPNLDNLIEDSIFPTLLDIPKY